MQLLYITLSLIVFSTMRGLAQENLEVYRGNKAFEKGDLGKANEHYRRATNVNPESFKGAYNSGNSSYRSENFEEAQAYYQRAVSNSKTAQEKSKAYHNLGNAYFKSQKLDESIQAYKAALRLNPKAEDTRYNLAQALRMKQQQEQNKDQQQDKKEGEKQEQNQEKSEKNEQEESKDKEQPKEKSKPKEASISERDAAQMLDAAKNDEEKTLLQLQNNQKKKQTKVTDKDW